MLGTITAADVLRHPWLIGHHYGLLVLGRCLWAVATRKRCTFLAMVTR